MGQRFQIGANKFQVGAETANRGKMDFKSGQRLQIGAGITYRCRTHKERNKFADKIRFNYIKLSQKIKSLRIVRAPFEHSLRVINVYSDACASINVITPLI